MGLILKDIRFGIRMLRKHPGLTVISVIALTLGIGLTTTMFSIVNGALLKGLPFEDAHEIMHLEENNLAEDIQSMGVPLPDYLDWRAQQTAFEDLAAFFSGTANVSGVGDRPERYEGAFITASAFAMLGVQPLLGRTFQEGEDQHDAEPVVVIGYAMWKNRFDSDPNVLGSTLRINGETMTVIGVMPEGFQFPVLEDLWIPLRLNPLDLEDRRDGTFLEVFGRLKDGASFDQAMVSMTTIAKRLEMEYPEDNEGIGVVIKPYTEEWIGEEPAALLYTMLAAVFGVLLIACANVANLLLARAAIRSKEVAIRSALGASRARVMMQLLSEAFVLSLVGGVLGLAIGWIGIELFDRAVSGTQPPFWLQFGIDPAVAAFVIGLTIVTSLLSGTLPALKASGANVNVILQDESRGSSSFRIGRLSKVLVIGEIAVSFGLLVAAGLMIKSVVKLRNIDLGFNSESVLTARVGLFEGDYPDSTNRHQFFQELATRLESRPAIETAALTSSLPGLGSGGGRFAVDGESYATEDDFPTTNFAIITPNYFETFDVGLLQGRAFTWSDNVDALQVAVVNDGFARKFFDGESPIGRRIRFGGEDSERPWRTIVGMVPDMYMDGIDDDEHEGMYVPLLQSDARFMSIAARTAADPMSLAPVIRDVVIAIDADLPIYFVDSMDGRIRQATWFYGVFGTLFMVFGFVALFLASIGLYGVMAFSVSRRTQEVGVRMALGAQGSDVLRLIFKQGLLQLGIGLLLGLGLAAALSNAMQIVLFRVEPTDPIIFVTIAAVLTLTGLAACFVPAKRATTVDPVIALRFE